MIFLLGFLCGFIIAFLIVVILIYFRRQIEYGAGIIENKINTISPKRKGFIVMPQDEAEEARANIIEENKKQGRDTPISDLE